MLETLWQFNEYIFHYKCLIITSKLKPLLCSRCYVLQRIFSVQIHQCSKFSLNVFYSAQLLVICTNAKNYSWKSNRRIEFGKNKIYIQYFLQRSRVRSRFLHTNSCNQIQQQDPMGYCAHLTYIVKFDWYYGYWNLYWNALSMLLIYLHMYTNFCPSLNGKPSYQQNEYTVHVHAYKSWVHLWTPCWAWENSFYHAAWSAWLSCLSKSKQQCVPLLFKHYYNLHSCSFSWNKCYCRAILDLQSL